MSPAQIPDWLPEAAPRAPSRSWSSSVLPGEKRHATSSQAGGDGGTSGHPCRPCPSLTLRAAQGRVPRRRSVCSQTSCLLHPRVPGIQGKQGGAWGASPPRSYPFTGHFKGNTEAHEGAGACLGSHQHPGPTVTVPQTLLTVFQATAARLGLRPRGRLWGQCEGKLGLQAIGQRWP